jgi:GrpB-like predicted nucleotidyltransferase (UPF0157 family)
VPAGSRRFAGELAFRDALRGDRALAADYAGLKRRLASDLRDDRETYTEAKAAFIESVLTR